MEKGELIYIDSKAARKLSEQISKRRKKDLAYGFPMIVVSSGIILGLWLSGLTATSILWRLILGVSAVVFGMGILEVVWVLLSIAVQKGPVGKLKVYQNCLSFPTTRGVLVSKSVEEIIPFSDISEIQIYGNQDIRDILVMGEDIGRVRLESWLISDIDAFVNCLGNKTKVTLLQSKSR